MIDFRVENLDRIMRVLNPDILIKAQTSALVRTRAKSVTQISKLARQKYNVSAGTVRDAVSRRIGLSLSRDKSAAYIQYIGRRIGLINFAAKFKTVNTPRGKRFGATTKLYKKKGRFLTKRGFIARGKGGNVQVFQRQKEGQSKRLPLNALYGPSIPQMVGSTEVLEGATKFVEKEYPIELLRQIEYQMSKL